MHEDSDAIPALQRRLIVHRRTIEYLERQRAQLGAFTPAYIWHQFDDTRGEIAQIKRELRARGVAVDDHPGDNEASPSEQPSVAHAGDGRALLLTYQRMIVDQLRYLPLAGLSAWADYSVRLDELYVERTPIALVSSAELRPQQARELVETKHPARGAPTSLSDLLGAGRARVIMEGAPGSGKTTCLHALALACAARSSGDSAAAELVAGWPDPLPLPILLPAREIDAALSRGNAALEEQRLPTLSAFWSAIEEWLRYSNLQALAPTIQQLFEQGGCLVLIDGLDDLPPTASQHAFLTALGRFVARYPDNSFVVACRNALPGLLDRLPSFARYQLPDLDQMLADAMVARWYAIVADRAGLLVPEDVTRRIAMLQGALHGDKRLEGLARTPLTLALCILVHAERHSLPADRAVVLRRLADVLLNGWGHNRAPGGPNPERRLDLLEPLAQAFQSSAVANPDHPAMISAAEIQALLAQGLAGLRAGQRRIGEKSDLDTNGGAGLLGWCCRYGLLIQAGYDAYAMPQRQLREYLAGRAMAATPDFVARAYALRRARHWRETLLHAIGEIGHGPAPHIARLLVRLLLHPPDAEPAAPADDILLAAECMDELGDRTRPDRALCDEVRLRLIELMGSASAPVAMRIQAGILLGRLGDTRFAGPLPPLADVAAGQFLMGTPDGYDDEGPEQLVDLPGFAIGVYPVTNQEYAAFLADRPAHSAPRYWYDSRLNNPSGPVVGVTWQDAAAYCAWLTERLDRAGRLPAGQVVRLPLEAEWEKAACWDWRAQAKRRYPWGDEWSSARANTADGRGTWLTAPVGCYSDGLSPYGLHDCIGNVWEWTASTYANYPGAGLAFNETGSYTLRGSSCASTPTHTRCTYRSRLPASYWRYHLGFRVVIGRPLDTPADAARE